MNRRPDKVTAAEELAVLHPDGELTLGNPPRKMVVRELRFVEGLRLSPVIKPIVDDMFDSFGTTDIEQVPLELFGELFKRHEVGLMELMCTAADVDTSFIEALSDAEGQQLLMTFWQVNALFFVRRLLARKMQQAGNRATSKASKARNAGASSTVA